MKKNFDVIFDKDDDNLNDYLTTWKEFENRPNKLSIYHSFDLSVIETILSDYKNQNIVSNIEIYPSENYSLENKRCSVKLTEEIFVSYTIYDVRSDESFVGDVVILYKNSASDEVNDLVKKLEDSSKDEVDEVSNEDSLFTLTLDTTGFNIVPVNYMDADYENIDLYFNSDVLKKVKKLSKKLSSDKKGISIIWGERGSGKSTLCCSMLQNVNKKKIIIPQNLIDTVFTSSEFKSYLSSNPDLTLIIDDVENLFSDLYLKTNNIIKNLIQLVDGLESDNFNLNIVLIINVDDFGDIDSDLLQCNNFIDCIEVTKLSVNKSNELSKKLKKNKKYKKEQKLIDILKKKNHTKPENVVGYE